MRDEMHGRWGRRMLRIVCLAAATLTLAGCVVVPVYPHWHPAPVVYIR